MLRRRSFAPVLALLLAALPVAAAGATTAGTLDASFGTGGTVSTPFTGGGVVRSLEIQRNGRIVALGSSSGDVALARYRPDGSLDRSFGRGGRVTVDVGGDGSIDSGNALAIGRDGKLLVAGATFVGGSSRFFVARLTSNGRLDRSFGDGGIVLTDFAGGASAHAVAVQTDGRIVAAGSSSDDTVLARYHANGSLDTGFGTGGTTRTSLGAAWALALQADGKLVVAGDDFVLARYEPDGALDPTFGTAGAVAADLHYARAVAIQRDGKLLVSGTAGAPNDFVVARYEVDGTTDAGFGSDGIVQTDFGASFDLPNALRVQEDGKIVAAGASQASFFDTWDFALARYDAEGTLDASFGSGGLQLTDFGGSGASEDSAFALAVQKDGRIVVAGATAGWVGVDFGPPAFALARYLR